MPFGLTNAPEVFQCLINDVLRDLLNRFLSLGGTCSLCSDSASVTPLKLIVS